MGSGLAGCAAARMGARVTMLTKAAKAEISLKLTIPAGPLLI